MMGPNNLDTKMNPPSNPPKQSEIIEIQSNLPPNRSIDAALKMARIFNEVKYRVTCDRAGFWKVEVLGGGVETVRKALKRALGLKVVD
jgi:hypothetical protein